MPTTARGAGLLLACAALLAAHAAGTQPYATVSGIVVNDRTGAPVPHALVILSTTGADPSDATTYTDSSGGFGFAFVPAGKYYLHADCDNCLHGWYGATTPEDPPATLQLQAGDQRRGLEVRVQPLGAISGTVLDPDGDPLAGASVELFVRGYVRRKPGLKIVRTAETNDRGEYRMFHVPPGTYVLMAEHAFTRANRVQVEGASGESTDEPKYAAQFYSNADRASAATTVTLAAGKELSGFDFRLPLRQTVHLKGKVAVPPNLPAGAPEVVEVSLQEVAGGSSGSTSAPARPPEYNFELEGVVPGEYLVSARASAEGREYIGAERVDVSRDSEQVVLRLDPGIELSGKVELEGEASGPLPRFHIRLVPGDPIASLAGTREADVKPDGTFHIPDVTPGIWDIGLGPIPRGGYLKAMHLGTQDVLTEDMRIGSDTTAPLNIIVSTRGAAIEGTVLDEGKEGKPVRAAVVLAPEGKFAEVESFYTTSLADDSGHFEMRGLTPGPYRLYAFEQMDPDCVQKPGALNPFRERGEPVELTEGSRISKQLRRIPAAPRATRQDKR